MGLLGLPMTAPGGNISPEKRINPVDVDLGEAAEMLRHHAETRRAYHGAIVANLDRSDPDARRIERRIEELDHLMGKGLHRVRELWEKQGEEAT